MLFTLSNLGRLEEATIDLGKDLIVLTGPNNSSKTYVAHAIYGFFRGVVDSLLQLVQDALVGDSRTREDQYTVNVVDLTRANLDAWLPRLCESIARSLRPNSDTVIRVQVSSRGRERGRDRSARAPSRIRGTGRVGRGHGHGYGSG